MENCKADQTPMVQSAKIVSPHAKHDEKEAVTKLFPYPYALCALICLAVRTRPELIASLSMVAKHIPNPRHRHWEAVKEILRYLKENVKAGLLFQNSDRIQLSITCDAEWGTDVDDRRSTSGIVCLPRRNVVSRKSKKQLSIAISSSEAAYIASYEAN